VVYGILIVMKKVMMLIALGCLMVLSGLCAGCSPYATSSLVGSVNNTIANYNNSVYKTITNYNNRVNNTIKNYRVYPSKNYNYRVYPSNPLLQPPGVTYPPNGTVYNFSPR
jgi:outer membrane lipoprotein-sorting protein